ncbi:alpha/beta hydrolase family protein [Sphingomonas hylomeconis]|uniref:Alpha/beta hydrolase family protein n=1 Tax=Sphingomonas hylomeconis TaxID=1395958 RepID=A0ABV7SVL8_9SPHN|nr:alpha/beta hydrolase [Sphingomonas hylomeconis]
MFRLAILALIALTPAVTAADTPKLLTWDDLTSRAKPVPDATIAYGDDHLQKVDLWLPAGPRPRGKPYPTVLVVHGGCWTTSIADRSLMNWVADDLRKAGYAVWNIDYRGVDRTGGGYPGTFQDAAKATDALRDAAAQYGLDAKHVVAIGHSAGGHLALWLAARARLPKDSPLHSAHPLKIAHVISLGGLPDLEATAASPDNGCGTEVVGDLLGKPTPARPDIYRDTSVPRLLPLRVPQDLVNGREDRIIPMRLATGYTAQARKAGDQAVLHIVPDTGHVELVAPDTEAWRKTKALLAAAQR